MSAAHQIFYAVYKVAGVQAVKAGHIEIAGKGAVAWRCDIYLLECLLETDLKTGYSWFAQLGYAADEFSVRVD